MKSFCIKCNNKEIDNFLYKNFKKEKIKNFYVSKRKFKIYDNIIIHYKGNNLFEFYNIFCDVLQKTIIKFYENNELRKIINLNYFYFSKNEQSIILNYCLEHIENSENIEFHTRKEEIYNSLLKYIIENKSFILDGFVQFRLKNYKDILEYIVDTSVNNYLIKKEFNEFVKLLKQYIKTNHSKENVIHILYKYKNTILLDSNYNEISIEDYFYEHKYLSDISFTQNDFILNALLKLLPKKIYLHLISEEDEFIETLKLIFEDRIFICKHCSLCTKHKIKN